MFARLVRIGPAWLVLVLLLAAAPPAARAATPAASHPASDAAPLTPAEAQQLIAVINSPARRDAFVKTLSQLVRASREEERRQAPSALTPHSLGAELWLGMAGFASNLAGEARQTTRAFRSFGQLGPWVRNIAANPADRAVVTASVWRLVVIIGSALVAALLAERLLRRPAALLGRAAGGWSRPPPPAPPPLLPLPLPPPLPLPLENQATAETAVPPGADPATPGAMGAMGAMGGAVPETEMEAEREGEDTRRRHLVGFLRLLHALRRIPFAAVHFLLLMVPVLVFVLVTGAFSLSGFTEDTDALLVVTDATHSFVIGGVLIGIATALFAPDASSLRLVLVEDRAARRVAFWCRVGITIGVVSFAAIGVAGTLGLPFFAAAALIKTVALVEHTVLACLIVASRNDVARRLQPPRRVRGATRRVLVGVARRWWLYALALDYGFWIVWAAEVRNGYTLLWTVTIETMAISFAGRLLGIALLGALERVFRLSPESVESRPWLRARVDRYYPVLRRLVTAFVVVVTAVTLLEVWGLHAYRWFTRGALGSQVVGAAVSVLAAIAIGVLVWEAFNTAVDRHMDRLRLDPAVGAARIARLDTLLPMLRILLFIFVATVVVLTVLSRIGVNVAPLLGGAGIIGVAIGFGSQKLVQDFITGIFLLLENTMQVGDAITAGGLSGTVEHLSIRTMRLRAGDGAVHVIPFSSVSTVTNTNRGLGNAAVSVDIAPDQDPDRAGEVLRAIALGMRTEDAFAPLMLTDLQYWGVNAVSSQAVTLVGQIGCTDKGRWGVQREFNRRVHQCFLEEGIRFASPSQSVTLRPAPGQAAPAPETAPPSDERDRPPTVLASPAPDALGHDR